MATTKTTQSNPTDSSHHIIVLSPKPTCLPSPLHSQPSPARGLIIAHAMLGHHSPQCLV
ncbi:HlyD family secretion protein [Sesbania bispinosa]|nr:HlyD family secretion protein [Sesbania bispinosa]